MLQNISPFQNVESFEILKIRKFFGPPLLGAMGLLPLFETRFVARA